MGLLAAPRDASSRARPPRPDRVMSSKFGDAPARGGRGRKRKLQQQAHRLAPENKTSVALPASAVYTQLVDFERRVDATLARKKAEVNEALRRVERIPRVVRLYVYNTFKPATETSVTLPPADDRAASGAGASTARVETVVEPASWTLHVHGRLLPPADAPPGDADRDLEGEPKFDAFVRRLEVRLDPALYPDPSEPGGGVVARWTADDAPRDAPPLDAFEVKRHGDRDCRVKIALTVDHRPERYKLSPGLATLLGIDIETRPRIVRALWQYAELHELLHPEDPSEVRLDERLRAVFPTPKEEEAVAFVALAERLGEVLEPAPAVELDYVVRTRGRKNPTTPDCYDLLVDLPAGGPEHHAFVERLGRDRDVEACDARIAAGVAKIAERAARRAFLLGFSQSPLDFVNTVVAAQARDMVVARGDGSTSRKSERRPELYKAPWVDEAVMRYIARKG